MNRSEFSANQALADSAPRIGRNFHIPAPVRSAHAPRILDFLSTLRAAVRFVRGGF